jgi:hypothetical protein
VSQKKKNHDVRDERFGLTGPETPQTSKPKE